MAKDKYRVQKLSARGEPVNDPQADSWTAFLNGEWTPEVPRRPGKYPIANKRQVYCGEVSVRRVKGDLMMMKPNGNIVPVAEGWDGWWWSVPMPPMLPKKVPKWRGGVVLKLVINSEMGDS